MSAIDVQRNNIARLFRANSKVGSLRNVIRINVGNTLEHEIAKLSVCFALQQEGKQTLTEAEFAGSGVFRQRADVVCLDDGICHEIVVSESYKSLMRKEAKWPLPIRIVRP